MNEPRRAAWVDDSIYRSQYPEDENVPRHGGRHPFTRSLIATVASLFVPGLGLVTASSKRARVLGWTTTVAFLGFGLFLTYRLVTNYRNVAGWAVQPALLSTVSIVLAVVAVVWVVLIVGTHLVRRPAMLTRTQRAVGAVVVGGCSLLVSTPLAVAARYAHDQANLVSNVFAGEDTQSQTRPTLEGKTVEDIWANKPRLNILLLGGDTDANRIETIHDRPILTDTIMVASIDTKTGETLLIQIPRNMARTPFPAGTKLRQQFPYGFYDGRSGENPDFMVNAIFSTIPRDYPKLVGPSTFPGADALKLGIGEAIGLPLDYFVLLNIDGLQKLIDAMGGVTVNINERLPIAGNSERPQDTSGWLQPGPDQHLNGYNAMWYARSRWSTDDYSRMQRQSCLVNAIIKQANPVNMLTRYEAIAEASSQMVETDMPQSVLPAVVDLALRVKGGNVKRLMFIHGQGGYLTTNPDFDLMQERVRQALLPVAATPSAAPTESPSVVPTTSAPTPSKTKKPSATPTASTTPTAPPGVSNNVTDACAYNPKP